MSLQGLSNQSLVVCAERNLAKLTETYTGRVIQLSPRGSDKKHLPTRAQQKESRNDKV